jgi:hypothetical protein
VEVGGKEVPLLQQVLFQEEMAVAVSQPKVLMQNFMEVEVAEELEADNSPIFLMDLMVEMEEQVFSISNLYK